MVRGITNKQASYLAALQREAGEPYCGAGMTAREASAHIGRLHELLNRGRRVGREGEGREKRAPGGSAAERSAADA